MPERSPANISIGRIKKRSLLAILGYGCLTLLVLAIAGQAYYIFFTGNFYAVIPGKVYRCGQLSGESLVDVIRKNQIQTVVNLRGCSPSLSWFEEECRATHFLNVAQEDICFSANRLPATHELRRLVEVLDRTQYPILLHCRHGADRTGLASAVVLLLKSDITFREARQQLSARFGHFNWGRLRYLDRFFDLYSEWLGARDLTHSPEYFREWIASPEFPGEGRCRVEALQVPDTIACGEPASLRVRVHNTGVTPLRFRSGTNAGYHVGFILFDDQDHAMAFGRAGLLDSQVLPGQSIDLTVVLPSINIPGSYRVLLDMVDEQQGWFYQLGGEPWEGEIHVVSHDR
jgi:hypothetical protein